MMSNIPSASLGEITGNSMGRVECSASVACAAPLYSEKLVHFCQSGRNALTQCTSMNVANASLSQSPFHHSIVTKSPNHMWAISWATTSAIRSRSVRLANV